MKRLFCLVGKKRPRYGEAFLPIGKKRTPAEPFTNGVFAFCFFFVRCLGFCIFLDSWVLRDPRFPAKKTIIKDRKPQSRKARQGHIEHVRKNSGSISQERRGHLDFCAVKCKNHGLAS